MAPLPPIPPAIVKRAEQLAQADFQLPSQRVTAPADQLEQATRTFGEAIQALPASDRDAIQNIHAGVDEWAKGKQDPDRLGQFLVRVMLYMDQRLQGLESGSTGDCQPLETVFKAGYQMVQVYASVNPP